MSNHPLNSIRYAQFINTFHRTLSLLNEYLEIKIKQEKQKEKNNAQTSNK